jgi:hypothetical protein
MIEQNTAIEVAEQIWRSSTCQSRHVVVTEKREYSLQFEAIWESQFASAASVRLSMNCGLARQPWRA